ncbi:MAG: hypothetical protein GTO45_16700 [Candidatus Aminicenantes bacterium]|nr:hypothetical protein [Candidatus Aminicenantes bacterium]NIM80381.1 hypothetical protein [Candidatus Aminicenantes bacterium]NIN19768.1 hypothetical protein [Candidatus Aminicenantes bacterium]NIN43650.1 hypothetical protein [Candidatus Aminicenantes bacterium]NIN86395.1 hypothetical protein [Candidatus Aminicenantes bacterium]
MARQTRTNRVRLLVNDRDIPLNPFVTEVFSNVIEGLVDSLDKIPEPRNKIEILIEKEENR